MSEYYRPRLVTAMVAGVVAFAVGAAACSSDESADRTGTTSVSTPPSAGGSAPVDSSTVTDPSTTESPSTTAAPATPATTTPDTTTPHTALVEPDEATAAALAEVLRTNRAGCDPLDTRACLLPFPSNAYTVADPASDTGLRVAFAPDSATANASGVPITFTEWNRNDGFSPNSTLLAYVPGIDVSTTILPPWTDLDESTADDATVVIVDSASGERVPLFAELDAKAADDADRALVIHPAAPLAEGHHYVVALRGMNESTGSPIEPGVVFRAYRDRIADPALDARRPAMEETFATLEAAGIGRDGLFLAWDFTVASERNISERMLSIRDQALGQLGDTAAPAFTVSAVTPNTDEDVALQITGTYTVPNFLTGDGGPGNAFFYGDSADLDALPVQNGTAEAGFVCNVSTATAAATEPAHLVQYGHGLLGSNFEIDASNVRSFANEHNVVFCATKWAGMSEDDIPNAAAALGDLTRFNTVADRLQQGMLNQIFLGRLMTRDGGLSSLAEMVRADGSPLIDTAHLDFDGNSQGGILGIMLAAVSPDIERAVFGVPGINFSLLLPRSVAFATYEAIFKPAYPNDLDRMIGLDLLQMLWDRGEGGGAVQHLTANPYAGTEAKQVLLDVAFGDWLVSELSALGAARAMRATIHRPVTSEGRTVAEDLGWGLESTAYPSDGSAIIIWDSGSDQIPVEGLPPSTGHNPHEDPRSDADVRTQKAAFLFDDTLIDVCGGQACTADATG